MNKTRLFKRHQIYLPTLSGLCLMSLVIFCIFWFSLRSLAEFLAYENPIGGKYLVVEGWLGSGALLAAIDRFKAGDYQFLLTTGGPQKEKGCDISGSYAESAAVYIVRRGLDRAKVIALPTPESAQDRTFLSAVIVRDWLSAHDKAVNAMDVFSGGVHARRTHFLYQTAFRNQTIDIGIIAAKPEQFSLQAWWRTSAGAKSVITEAVGFLWAKCCFFPGKYCSHREKWGIY